MPTPERAEAVAALRRLDSILSTHFNAWINGNEDLALPDIDPIEADLKLIALYINSGWGDVPAESQVGSWRPQLVRSLSMCDSAELYMYGGYNRFHVDPFRVQFKRSPLGISAVNTPRCAQSWLDLCREARPNVGC